MAKSNWNIAQKPERSAKWIRLNLGVHRPWTPCSQWRKPCYALLALRRSIEFTIAQAREFRIRQARNEVVELLLPRMKPQPGMGEVNRLIDQALEYAWGRQLEADALEKSQKIFMACSELATAIPSYLSIQCSNFATHLPLEDQARFLCEVNTLKSHTNPTAWMLKKVGKGRPRLSVQVIALHQCAHTLLERSELKPRNQKEECARLGALLCKVAELQLIEHESTRAAELACTPKKLADYGLLPYDPLLRVEIDRILNPENNGDKP